MMEGTAGSKKAAETRLLVDQAKVKRRIYLNQNDSQKDECVQRRKTVFGEIVFIVI